ncbi:hypothetical protein [Maricaulis sp.]|uniref:hypothetical protein n=1 Tax=Maricaulis sp. TaxID=1486257 RepID=UPI003A923035
MRHILSALAATLCLSATALAGPGADLAETARQIATEAQARADYAAARPAAPAAGIELGDPLLYELDQFSADAMRLSRAIDEAGGPIDLRCIFRGMSGDAASRLEALNAAETSADQARVYHEISALMHDAAEIAPAADGEALPDTVGPPGTCPAARD